MSRRLHRLVRHANEFRVPQATSSSIVARKDFLPTDVRVTAPAVRGTSLIAGFPPGGSGGPWAGTDEMANRPADIMTKGGICALRVTSFISTPEAGEYNSDVAADESRI